MLTCMSMIGMNLCFNEPWGRESVQDQYLTFIYCILCHEKSFIVLQARFDEKEMY